MVSTGGAGRNFADVVCRRDDAEGISSVTWHQPVYGLAEWPVSFSIQTKIPERQPESEQLSKAASDQAPAKTEKTVIMKQKLPKVAIISLRSKKKGQLVIRWKKKQGIGGYEVQYGIRKTFKQARTKKVSGKGKTGITLKKLKRKRTYYVRMRSWKIVQGRCVYGAWSKVRKVRIKIDRINRGSGITAGRVVGTAGCLNADKYSVALLYGAQCITMTHQAARAMCYT